MVAELDISSDVNKQSSRPRLTALTHFIEVPEIDVISLRIRRIARLQFSGHQYVADQGDWGLGWGFVLCYISRAPAACIRSC